MLSVKFGCEPNLCAGSCNKQARFSWHNDGPQLQPARPTGAGVPHAPIGGLALAFGMQSKVPVNALGEARAGAESHSLGKSSLPKSAPSKRLTMEQQSALNNLAARSNGTPSATEMQRVCHDRGISVALAARWTGWEKHLPGSKEPDIQPEQKEQPLTASNKRKAKAATVSASVVQSGASSPTAGRDGQDALGGGKRPRAGANSKVRAKSLRSRCDAPQFVTCDCCRRTM